MTIKTLEYIHRLLLDSVEVHQNARNLMYQCVRDAEDANADNLDTLKGQYDIAYKNLSAARDALSDFEMQEF